MMATKLAVAALVILVALLAGPAVCEDIICFNGWVRLPIEEAGLCPPVAGMSPSRTRALPPPSASGLDLVYGYYNNRTLRSSYCPKAERIVKAAVRKAVAANPGIGAGLIRLFNHDCFVRGCDASVLLNETNSKNEDTEREGRPNKKSLRGFEVIDVAKAAIEVACPGIVSCADIVAFAARDASYFLSNRRIYIRMPGGRYDGRESFANETSQLPGPNSNTTAVARDFAAKGLTLDEMVWLKDRCGCDNQTNVNQDHMTPDVLDRRYYQDVIDRKVLFTSDAMLNSADTIKNVRVNANKAGAWESKFEKAMEKMGRIGVKTRPGNGLEIRKVCWRVNN